MWMTRKENSEIDFAVARDEGLGRIGEIASNYASEIPLSRAEMETYLSKNISYSVDDSMRKGMEEYFKLSEKHKLIPVNKSLAFI